MHARHVPHRRVPDEGAAGGGADDRLAVPHAGRHGLRGGALRLRRQQPRGRRGRIPRTAVGGLRHVTLRRARASGLRDQGEEEEQEHKGR